MFPFGWCATGNKDELVAAVKDLYFLRIKSAIMTIKIEGISQVLEILSGLFSAVKKTANLSAERRKEMREALANTAELIEETLTILKQHLSAILTRLREDNMGEAEAMIANLSNFQEWENRYRQFRLCNELRDAAYSLERKGLYALPNSFALDDPQKIVQLMWDYIGGETNAAHSVGEMLVNLSQLAPITAVNPGYVIEQLEAARKEVQTCRQRFLDLELEIREAVA